MSKREDRIKELADLARKIDAVRNEAWDLDLDRVSDTLRLATSLVLDKRKELKR